MFPLLITRTCETRLHVEAGIPGPRDTSVPIIGGTCTDTVCSFLPQCGLEEPVLVPGCYTSTFYCTDRLERLEYGSRSMTGLTGQDFRDLGRICRVVPSTGPANQSVIHGMFMLSRLWAKILFDSGALHSFVTASNMDVLGLEVQTLEESLHMSYPLGTRMRIDQICRDCELEISGILLTVDLRVMDISNFDVILGMDWLTAHRVVIDCDSRRITAYARDSSRVTFQGEKHDALPQTVHDSKWSGKLTGWIASLTLEDEGRQDSSLPRVVCEYEDVFPDELRGLPPHKDVDFVIELHLGTSPISMTPHRMAPVELHELKVQL